MNLLFWYRSLMRSVGAALVKLIATATSGLVSFTTNVIRPVKVTCEFSPVQDMHGMDYPYPAGASVNLIPDVTDTSNGYKAGKYYRIDNTANNNENYYTSEYFEIDQTKTYTFSTATISGKSPAILFYDANKEFISGINFESGYTQTFTPPEGAVYARAPQTTDAYQESHDPYVYYQLEEGSTATPYQRYSNICPIEGWGGCDINKTTASRNIINLVSGNIINVTGGYTIRSGYQLHFASNEQEAVVLFPVKPNTVYTYVGQKGSGGTGFLSVFEYSDKPINKSEYQISTITNSFNTGTSLRRKTFTTSSDAKYIGISISKLRGSSAFTFNLSAYIGENTTDTFGNYAVDTIPITFTDPTAGDPMTVYGGTVTLNEDGSADVVSNYGIKIFTGNENWQHSSGWTNDPFYYVENRTDFANSSSSDYGNILKPANATVNNVPLNRLVVRNVLANKIHFLFRSDENLFGTTVAEVKQSLNDLYLAGTPLTYVGKLKTNAQHTYHFDSIGQLKSFLGTNNIWHNMNGDITVEYWKKQ